MFSKFLGLFRRSGAEDPADLHSLLAPRDGVPLIQLKKVNKLFVSGDVQTRALVDIDLEINSGEFVTVAGPSGSGKSTVMHIIGLLESPSSGTYLLNGNPVEKMKPGQLAWLRNRFVGFIFQNFNLIGDLTAYQNVETPLTYLGMPSPERRRRVLQALDQVRMTAFANRYPSQMTGGEQQRVAVARALAGDPALLLADEPTGNLDSANGEIVMELLQGLHARGATLFLVTHNPDYAERSERCIDLLDGKLEGEPIGASEPAVWRS